MAMSKNPETWLDTVIRCSYNAAMNKQFIGNLSSQQLRRALEIKEKIEALEAQLNSLLETPAPAAVTSAPKAPQAAMKPGGRTPMSPEARARIVAAQKLRWAKIRAKAKEAAPAKPAAAQPAKAPKRKVSAAVRARLAELARARWAKIKAAGKSHL